MPSNLENLVAAGSLRAEPPAQAELDGLVSSGKTALRDAEVESLSIEGRFALAYNAAFSLALAALRFRGYRPSNNRQVVFQTTPLTLQLSNDDMRVLSDAHRKRNDAAYEGIVDVSEALVKSLLRVARELEQRVLALMPMK